MPIFITIPDRKALTGDGAAGCASGSQVCNGTAPALIKQPTKNSIGATKLLDLTNPVTP